MVELPTGRPRLITTEAPRQGVSARDMQAMNAPIAAGLRKLGEGLEDVAVPLAEKQGKEDAARAIQLDENGNVQIATPANSFILGRAGNAYQTAKETELLVAGRTQVDKDLLDIRQRHLSDPEAYAKEASTYLNSRRNANVAGIGQQTFDYGLRIMQQHHGNMIDQKAANDFKQTGAVFSGRMAQLQGQEDSLLMQGVSSGAEWDRIQGEKAEIRNEMQRNPRFNYDQRLRALDEGADQQRRAGLAIAYEGRNRIRAGDPPDVVVRDIEERLSKMGFGQEQLQKFVGIARQNVQGMSAARAANRQQAEADADLAIASLKGGDTIDDGKASDIIQRLAANGGERKAADFIAQRRLHEEIWPILQNPDASAEERAYAMGELKTLRETGVTVPGARTARSGPGMPALRQELSANEVGLLNAIAGPESRGLYNIRYTGAGGITFNGYQDHPRLRERIPSGANAGKTSDAAGRYQFLSSTWDSLPAEAKGDGSFTPANQDRAALWLAKRDYRRNTGRDLMADIDANGMTPQILQALSGTWEGFQSAAGRQKAIAAFNGSSQTAQYPVRDTVIKEVQRTYDGNLEPVVGRLIKSYESGNPPTQQDLDDFRQMYPLSSKSDEKGNLAKLFRLDEEYLTKNGLPVGEGLTVFSTRLNEAEKRGELDPQGVMVARVAREAREEQDKLRADDPLELGRRTAVRANMQDVYGRRGTIDWTNPDAMIGELWLRRHQADWTRNIDPLVGQMPLYADDRKSLAQTLPALDGNQARAVLATLGNTFSREQMNALMGDKAVRDAVIGLTRNPDPAKMKAGFDLMAQQLAENSLEFRSTFGEAAEKSIYQYQVLASSMTPQQIAERLTKAKSPRDADTRKRWEADANSAMEKLTSAQIFKEVSREQSGFFKYWAGMGLSKPMSERELAGMGYDYAQAYKAHYGEYGDEDAAKAYATDRVKQNWGESAATGRLMRNPPDKAVPKVNGSHEWMRAQLQGDLMKALGVDPMRIQMDQSGAPPTGLQPKEQKAFAVSQGNFELVADSKTEADIANKRPPSYIVVVKNPNGLPEPLAIEPGKAVRWIPDHKRAMHDARSGLMLGDDVAKLMRENRITMRPM